MVAPLIVGAGITAGAGLLSSMLASRAGNQAAGVNAQIAQNNMDQQAWNSLLERVFAERMLQMQSAPRIGPNQERQEYIPGVGWVTTIDPALEGAIGAENSERLRRATQGAQRQAYEEEQSFDRRQDEGRLADLFLQRATGAPRYGTADVRNILSNAASAGINEGYDRTSENAARQLTRSQSSNAGPILAALASRRGQDLSAARAGANAQALTLTPALNQQEQQQNLSMYDVLRGRSANYNEVPITFSSAPNTNAFAATAQQGPGAALMANSFKPLLAEQVQPNYSSALGIGAAGSAIGGIFEQWASNDRYNDLIGILQDRQKSNTGKV